MKDPHDKVTLPFPEMEGDFIYTKAEHAIDKADLEYSDGGERERNKAFEESYFHQAIVDFERLLFRYGLDHLLGQMSTKGAHELLLQAHDLFHKKQR